MDAALAGGIPALAERMSSHLSLTIKILLASDLLDAS